MSKLSSADSEPANWKRWGQRVSAQLWEAVALSIDIEPESLPIDDWRPADYSDPFEECPCEFKLRIDVAIDHAKNGHLQLTSFAFTDPPFSDVRLQDFSDWAGSLGWSLPNPFPRRVLSVAVSPAGKSDSASPPTDAPTWTAGTRTNKAEAAERACEEHLRRLQQRPKNKDTAFAAAVIAVADHGPLSRKAFEHAWKNGARPEWKVGGARKGARKLSTR